MSERVVPFLERAKEIKSALGRTQHFRRKGGHKEDKGCKNKDRPDYEERRFAYHFWEWLRFVLYQPSGSAQLDCLHGDHVD